MFLQEFADYVVNFIQCLNLTDDFYGKAFALQPWQKEIVSNFYGNMREDLTRCYEYLYLEIPKKNGKSQLSAALGLYHTFADGARDGEVYVVAADRDNAGIVFGAALGMLKQCPALMARAIITESRRMIRDTVTGTVFRVLSSEAGSKHGYKPTCVIFDELHSQPNRDLWDVLTFGAGDARKQPVWIVLTTAGDDPDRGSIGWEVHAKARSVIEYRKGNRDGHYDLPNWLPYIYGMPDDPEECAKIDIFDEALWYSVNPSLGVTIPVDKLRLEAEEARHSEAMERLFRWLRLNQWIAVKTVGWLPLPLYDKTEKPIKRELLRGKRCFGGLDLSSTTDLTALVLLFPPQAGLDTWYYIYFIWTPLEGLKERSRRDHVDYVQWQKDGVIEMTPGNCIDFDFVEAQIEAAAREYKLELLGVDPYLSRMITQHLMAKRIAVVEIPQTMSGMSPAMKALEVDFRKGRIAHEKNGCGRWTFGNVRCAVDGNENIKPMKNRSTGRIDPTVGLINAKAAAMLAPADDVNARILSEEWSM